MLSRMAAARTGRPEHMHATAHSRGELQPGHATQPAALRTARQACHQQWTHTQSSGTALPAYQNQCNTNTTRCGAQSRSTPQARTWASRTAFFPSPTCLTTAFTWHHPMDHNPHCSCYHVLYITHPTRQHAVLNSPQGKWARSCAIAAECNKCVGRWVPCHTDLDGQISPLQ